MEMTRYRGCLRQVDIPLFTIISKFSSNCLLFFQYFLSAALKSRFVVKSVFAFLAIFRLTAPFDYAQGKLKINDLSAFLHAYNATL
jgi:hypothetical protein